MPNLPRLAHHPLPRQPFLPHPVPHLSHIHLHLLVVVLLQLQQPLPLSVTRERPHSHGILGSSRVLHDEVEQGRVDLDQERVRWVGEIVVEGGFEVVEGEGGEGEGFSAKR